MTVKSKSSNSSTFPWYLPLKTIFDEAIRNYESGKRGPAKLFKAAQVKYFASIGHTPQEVYDFVEDYVTSNGEVDWETVLLIAAVRRDYWLTIQKGSTRALKRIDSDTLPAKTDKLGGIAWLPRLIEKAEAKLRGQMPDELMYDCGGDRKFFNVHQIHPADFLRVVWAANGNEKKVLKYVKTGKF
jgi:hypothetical protein